MDDPASLLSGRALAEEGILGAVEPDFFDWPLRMPDGAKLVREVAEQAARFRLRDVEADVLKVLYESLVDPDQRHDLGEYYTPDWLAGRRRWGLLWREEGEAPPGAGKRAKVHGTPMARVKKSAMAGEVYWRAVMGSPQTFALHSREESAVK